jgi:hypothetical protein
VLTGLTSTASTHQRQHACILRRYFGTLSMSSYRAGTGLGHLARIRACMVLQPCVWPARAALQLHCILSSFFHISMVHGVARHGRGVLRPAHTPHPSGTPLPHTVRVVTRAARSPPPAGTILFILRQFPTIRYPNLTVARVCPFLARRRLPFCRPVPVHVRRRAGHRLPAAHSGSSQGTAGMDGWVVAWPFRSHCMQPQLATLLFRPIH